VAEQFYKDLYENKFEVTGSSHHTLNNDRFRKTISLVLRCKPHAILDLGFESQALSKAIIKHTGANYVGVDISDVVVKAAKRSLSIQGRST